jgi:hypothetical protein
MHECGSSAKVRVIELRPKLDLFHNDFFLRIRNAIERAVISKSRLIKLKFFFPKCASFFQPWCKFQGYVVVQDDQVHLRALILKREHSWFALWISPRPEVQARIGMLGAKTRVSGESIPMARSVDTNASPIVNG